MSRVFAYCRVSTLEQNTENQRREIEAAGFAIRPQRLFEEYISGSVAAAERPGFMRLLDRMENGDVLIVTKLGTALDVMLWTLEKPLSCFLHQKYAFTAWH